MLFPLALEPHYFNLRFNGDQNPKHCSLQSMISSKQIDCLCSTDPFKAQTMAGLSKNPKQIGWCYTATEAENRRRWWLWSEHIWFKNLTFVWSVHLITSPYENWFLVDLYSVCIYLPWQYIIKTETLNIWIYIQPHFKENVSRKYLDAPLKKKNR